MFENGQHFESQMAANIQFLDRNSYFLGCKLIVHTILRLVLSGFLKTPTLYLVKLIQCLKYDLFYSSMKPDGMLV